MKVGTVFDMAGKAFVGGRAALLIGALLIAALSAAACGRAPKGEQAAPKDGVFTIDCRGIEPGQVRFYRCNTGGKSVVFFVARGRDGAIRTAFDACRSCYPRRLGYRAEEGSVTCTACGMVFKLDELDRGEGGCVPVLLKSESSGDRVTINSTDVEQGASYF